MANATDRRGRGYRSRLTRTEQAALDAVARRMGYETTLDERGAALWPGVVLILSILDGEVTPVLLPDDERPHVAQWLAQQAEALEATDYLLSEQVASLARQLHQKPA